MLTYEELLKERDEIIERLKSENASFRETIFRMAEKEIFVNKLLLVNEEVDKYKAWKEAEEQGLLLKLPCKVGTPVWTIMCGMTGKNPTLFRQDFELAMIQYWNKAVFLTKAEAEKALAEMEK